MFDAESIALPDEGPLLGKGILQVLVVLLLVIGWIVGFNIMRTDPGIAWAVIAGSTLPAAIVGLLLSRLLRRIGRANLLIKDTPVPLGWSGTVTYVRPLRGGATMQSIEARLQCEEHVEKGKGKHHKEWRQVVVDEPLSVQSAPMLEQLRVTIPIRIPAAGPSSFQTDDNRIVWWVRLRLKMEGCPNTRSSFRLEVAPAVVSR